MDITPSTIYWITRLGSLRDFCIFALGISTVIVITLAIVRIAMASALIADNEHEVEVVRRWINRVLVVSAFASAGVLFCPSKQEMAAMYVVPSIVNNEKVQNLGNGMYDLALEWMASLKPGKKEEN